MDEIKALIDQDVEVSLSTAINRNIDRIEDYYNYLYPDDNFNEVKLKINELVASKKINEEFLANIWSSYVLERLPDLFTGPALMSYVYSIAAQNANNNNDNEKGWQYITVANHLSGMSSAELLLNKTSGNIEKQKEIRIQGGIKRAEKYLPAKEEAIRLLNEKRPADGWTSEKEAVSAILNDFTDFACVKRRIIAPTNPANTLRKWIKNDPKISRAFSFGE